MKVTSSHAQGLQWTGGFSLIELLVSTLFITLAISAFTGPLILTMKGSAEKQEESIALVLAKDLLEEVRGKRFEDPGETLGSFGREEDGMGYRDVFDDIDDYDGLLEGPPMTREGLAMDGIEGSPNFSRFRRKVIVENVDPRNFDIVHPDGTTDSKRITVTAWWYRSPLDSLSSRRGLWLYTVRSRNWRDNG